MDDNVFKALAHPTRRALLDALFARDGRSLKELSAGAGMTRFGVMKHLERLVAAGLVTTRREGREKRHYLNRVPVRRIYERWVEKYTEGPAAALLEIKRRAEGRQAMPRHVFQIFIEATPETIWRHMTTPELTSKFYHGTMIDSSLRPGDPVTYRLPDGRVAVEGTIIEAVPPQRLAMTWMIRYDPERASEKPSEVVWEIEKRGEVSCVTVTHTFPEENRTYHETLKGRMAVLSALKTLLETGRPMARPQAA